MKSSISKIPVCCLAFLVTLFGILINTEATAEAGEPLFVRVRLESCPGCKLNRLPEVKAFVYEDFPKYYNAEFKKIHGASPELLFLNEADEVVERHSLEHLSRQQCNNLLIERGFTQKKNKEL